MMGQKILSAEIAILMLQLLRLLVTAQECTDGEVRLERLGSTTRAPADYPHYCYNGEWRMFCADDGIFRYTQATRNVMCRHNGFNDQDAGTGVGDPITRTLNFVRPPSPPMTCIGTENRIQDCGDLLGVNTTCAIATLICRRACTNGDIRLVGGSTNREGRVEVCVDGRWGTVCNNQEGLARTVCDQLGFPEELNAEEVTSFPQGFIPISNCTVQNGSSLSCGPITDASCDHSMDLGVVCHCSFEELYNELRSQCLDPVLSGPTPQPCDNGSNNVIIPALGVVIGVLVALLFGAVTALVITCGALKKSKQRSLQNTPGPANLADYGRSADQPNTQATNTAGNPAYDLFKHDQREECTYYEVMDH